MKKPIEEGFAVKSKYMSVYGAYKTELEKMGIVWNSRFNEFNKSEFERTSCVYVSKNWCVVPDTAKPGSPLMSFTNPGDRTQVFDLDTAFAEAIDVARRFLKAHAASEVVLNPSYTAVVYEDRIEVGCQTIGREAALELANAIFKRMK